MTFSIVARCRHTGMFGVAVASSSPAVAARCAFAEAGIGAVASQNITDPSLGTRALGLLRADADALETIETLLASSKHMDYRQVLIVDRSGNTTIHSGEHILGTWAEAATKNAAAAGNMLANTSVPKAMVHAFEETETINMHLADRLLDVMRAGLQAGGEEGPIHSAGFKVVDRLSWPIVDLRVDWTDDCPITELDKLWARYKPQMEDYVTRALDPSKAPSYGVPGNE